MNPQRLNAILSGEDRSIGAILVRAGCAVAEPFYRCGVGLRNAMFDHGWRTLVDLGRPTISVGNITTGGTGKTPMVIEVVRRLRLSGITPAILLRGYAMTDGLSDEAQLYRDAFDGAVTVEANPDRVAGAQAVLKRDSNVRVFILDDAFQHRRVRRDLDLVLIDATRPFGFDRLLPRGLLREPDRNLRRATAVIITRADQSTQPLDELDSRIESLTGSRPIAHCAHRWTGFRDQNGCEHAPDHLAQATVIGYCGIGNDAAFGRSLSQHTRKVLQLFTYPDHHTYPNLTDMLTNRISTLRPDAVVVTDKDWVKWQHRLAGVLPAVPIYRPMLKLDFLDGGDRLDKLLSRLPAST